MTDHRGWDSVYAQLNAVPEVAEVDLSLVRGLATIRLGAPCPPAALVAAVQAAGFDAEVWAGDPPNEPRADA